MSRMTAPQSTRGPAPSHSPPDTRYAPGLRLSRALGWFSIGLGLAEILAPEQLARCVGLRNSETLSSCGLREIFCGIGILNSNRPTVWMWARVAGDMSDLRILSEGLADSNEQYRQRATMALLAVGGVTALDVLNASQLSLAASMEG